MKETTKQNLAFASAAGAIVSILFTVAITIGAELLPNLKDWLRVFSGHHWVSKSIFSMVVYAVAFAAFFLLCRKTSAKALRQALFLLIGTTITGVIAILAFFAWHYFAA